MSKMLQPTTASNNQVVQINASTVLMPTESIMYDALKNSGSIGQAHRHNYPLKLPLAANKSTLTRCIISHTNLVESVLKIHSTECGSTSKAV